MQRHKALGIIKTHSIHYNDKAFFVELGGLADAGCCFLSFKVTRPRYFVRMPSNFEALWYPHLYFDRKSNI